MEIREMNDSHEQQLELAVQGIHMRVTPDIVGASVSEGRIRHTKGFHLRHVP